MIAIGFAVCPGTSFDANATLPATEIRIHKIAELTFVGRIAAVDAERGTVTLLVSMEGTVTAVDAAHGTFTLLGRTIRTDAQTNIRNPVEPRQLFIVLANLHGNEIVAVMVGRWFPELD